MNAPAGIISFDAAEVDRFIDDCFRERAQCAADRIIAEMKTIEDCRQLARERNIPLATVETWERAVSATPEEKVRAMRELFQIISCADSVVLQESMCAEVARLLIVPAHAVLEDYRAWLRGRQHTRT